jgi:hypothetical protein
MLGYVNRFERLRNRKSYVFDSMSYKYDTRSTHVS